MVCDQTQAFIFNSLCRLILGIYLDLCMLFDCNSECMDIFDAIKKVYQVTITLNYTGAIHSQLELSFNG